MTAMQIDIGMVKASKMNKTQMEKRVAFCPKYIDLIDKKKLSSDITGPEPTVIPSSRRTAPGYLRARC